MSQKKYSALYYFKYFRNVLGHHIYVFIVLNFLVGLLDGIGLTMFIPLISYATNSNNTEQSLGYLNVVIDFFKSIGINLTVTNILLLMVFLFSAKGLINYLKTIYITKININVTKRLRFKLIDGLGNLSYHGFTTMSVGRIQNHIFGECNRLIQSMQTYINSIQYTTMMSTYAFLAFMSNWQFAIMVAIGGYTTDFIYKYLNRMIADYSRKQVNLGNNFNELLIQSVNNFKYLKATNYFKRYDSRLRDNIELNDEYAFKMNKLGFIMINAREPMILLVISIVVMIQVNVLNGNLESILISLLLFYRGLGHLVNLQGASTAFTNQATSIESINTILKEFKDNEEPLKTTPIEKIDNINIKNIEVILGNKTVLNKIGYITQEPVIFNDTLFNNVSFWAEKTPESIDKFYKVMDMVSLRSFVEELENKEDSFLGNNGILVSGGQKQRISIARELYKDVELLIMDEATSALDSETERHIKENIDMLHGKFTMVIIAHRLSTIKNVDKVYLLEKGEIVNSGSYIELTKSSEKFRKMVELQEL